MSDSHTNYGTNTRQINYLVNDFLDFKQSALLRIKQYFPDRANLFAPDSDGDIFLLLHSRIGDILKFQMNRSINLSQIDTAINEDSIFLFGKTAGFYNLSNTPSFGFVNMSFIVPTIAINTTSGSITSSDYIPTIKRGSTITVNGQSQYIITNDVIFNRNSSTRGDQSIILQLDGTYLVTKKNVFVMRGAFLLFNVVIDLNQSVGTFFRLQLPRKNITQIVDVKTGRQANGTVARAFRDVNNLNHWYQYPYLCSRSIFKVVELNGSQKVILIDTPYKYVVLYDKDGNTFLVFGPGRSFINNAGNVLSFRNVYAPISGYTGVRTLSISPLLFMFSSSLGYSPGDTNNKVLSVKYIYGGGTTTNVLKNTDFSPVEFIFNNISSSAQDRIKGTMIITNDDVLAGGLASRNTDLVKQIVKRFAGSQNRIVNTRDYIRRIKARPNIYGGSMSVNVVKVLGVTKAYIANKTSDNKTVSTISRAVQAMNKSNMIKYLSKYAILDDNFDIRYRDVKDILVNFQISIYDYLGKQNIQNDIATAILRSFSNYTVKLLVGMDVDFNSLVDSIRNQFKAVRYVAQVRAYDKLTGRPLRIKNNVLPAINDYTIYNVSDYFNDITISMI